MDGKDVIAQARQFTPAPIVVLSARDREAEKIAALDLGADDYVEKPFAIGELLARLRAALRHAKARRRAEDARRDRRPDDRHGQAAGHARRRADQADAARIRSAVRARRQRRPGDDARPDPHRGLGPRAQGRHAVPARLRRPVARQDRARPSAPTIIRTESGIGYRFAESVQPPPTPTGHETPVPPRPQ